MSTCITRRELEDAVGKARQVLVAAEELQETVEDFVWFLCRLPMDFGIAAALHQDAMSDHWESKL